MSETLSLEQLVAWMRAFQTRVVENRDYLTELDAKVGDADHGSNMVRGVNAVVERLEQEPPQNVSDFGKTVRSTGRFFFEQQSPSRKTQPNLPAMT